MLKIVNLSLAVLNLYRCCINLVSQFNWPCYVFLTLKWRTLHLTHQKLSQMHGFLWRTNIIVHSSSNNSVHTIDWVILCTGQIHVRERVTWSGVITSCPLLSCQPREVKTQEHRYVFVVMNSSAELMNYLTVIPLSYVHKDSLQNETYCKLYFIFICCAEVSNNFTRPSHF